MGKKMFIEATIAHNGEKMTFQTNQIVFSPEHKSGTENANAIIFYGGGGYEDHSVWHVRETYEELKKALGILK